MSLDEVLLALAQSCVDRANTLALAEASGRRLSYAALGRQVEWATEGLRRLGLRPGDRVLFAVRPSLEAIVLILAILRNGGVVVAADLGWAKLSSPHGWNWSSHAGWSPSRGCWRSPPGVRCAR